MINDDLPLPVDTVNNMTPQLDALPMLNDLKLALVVIEGSFEHGIIAAKDAMQVGIAYNNLKLLVNNGEELIKRMNNKGER